MLIRWYRFWSLLLILLSTSMISACAVTQRALNTVGLGEHNALSHLAVESVFNSNANTPVALDFVFVYDKNVIPLLSELSGPSWFSQREAIQNRYADALELISLEVVPLSYLDPITLPKKHKRAHEILLFANYRRPQGQFMATLGHFKSLKVRLLDDRYQLIEP